MLVKSSVEVVTTYMNIEKKYTKYLSIDSIMEKEREEDSPHTQITILSENGGNYLLLKKTRIKDYDLITAANHHDDKEAVKRMKKCFKEGAVFNLNTLLKAASFQGNLESVRYLIGLGAKASHVNWEGRNALYSNLSYGVNLDIISLLISEHSVLSVQTIEGDSLLTEIDKRLKHFKEMPPTDRDEKEILRRDRRIIELFEEYYDQLVEQDQKIIDRYKIRHLLLQ